MNRTARLVIGVVGAVCIVSPVWADGLGSLALSPQWAWLPGTLFGVLAGLWGAAMGSLAPRGRGKTFVMAFGAVLIVATAVMLLIAFALLFTGNPFWGWYPWLLPGAIGLFVVFPLLRVARIRYAEAETRKMQAMNLT